MGRCRRPQLQRDVRKENESAVVSYGAGAGVRPGEEECLPMVEVRNELKMLDADSSL